MLRIHVRVFKNHAQIFQLFCDRNFYWCVTKQKYTVKITELSHENDITWGYIATVRIELSNLVAFETNFSIWQFHFLSKQKRPSLNRDYKYMYPGMTIHLGIFQLEIS